MALSGTVSALLAACKTISALALYPLRMLVALSTCTAALISNWLAPLDSTAFGEMYSNEAVKFRFCNAPMVIFMFIPGFTCPTSVSSILPLKIRSFMLATLAMVVPSLNVLLRITELPTFTGISSIIPVMVERISVELALALLFETPSRTTCKLSSAADSSSLACW